MPSFKLVKKKGLFGDVWEFEQVADPVPSATASTEENNNNNATTAITTNARQDDEEARRREERAQLTAKLIAEMITETPTESCMKRLKRDLLEIQMVNQP